MNDWVSRLAALLRDLTGEELSIENAGTGRVPNPGPKAIWWKSSSVQPSLTVWLGMDEVAAAALIKKSGKAIPPSGEVKSEYRAMLGRLDDKGEIIEQGPPGPLVDDFTIVCPGIEALHFICCRE